MKSLEPSRESKSDPSKAPESRTVLIVGASGLVGTAAVNAFHREGWTIVAVSRSESVFLEEGVVDERYRHIALDLRDSTACAELAAQFTDVTHVVYTAVFELPGLLAGWSDPHQIDTNGRMLDNLMTPLLANAQVEHVTLLQGTKAYGAAVQPMRVPARESQPRVDHANFYWLQEDFLKQVSQRIGFGYTILRPQLIVGPNYGVVMNLPPVIGVYAAMRQYEGKPFAFPGGKDWVWEAADVRLVADACVWAAITPEARNETFNVTNGEVFLWRDMWPAIASSLGVEPGPDEPTSLVEYFGSRRDLWTRIAADHHLQPSSLDVMLGESHHYADMCLAYGTSTAPPPTFVSTVKIKQAGFTDTCNSEESFCHWIRQLQTCRVLPMPG